MMDLHVFDAWEPVSKAKKPIGLAQWSRLSYMADKLKDKKASDLSFTTCYPGQEGSKKTLGSIEGNLQFLLGYGNPMFHFAPYHWQVIDPNLSDEEAEVLYHLKGHPSRVELWERTSLKPAEEGDQEVGQPHPSSASTKLNFKKKKARAAESITVESGAGKYSAVPSEGLVYGEHNQHVYVWEMMRDSFFAAANPEMTAAMDEPIQEMQKSVSYADPILYHSKASVEFGADVYPFVKSLFPKPGSIIPVSTHQDERVYAVMKSNTLQLFDPEGCALPVRIYDRVYDEIDLTVDGDAHPSIIASFAKSILNLSIEEFLSDSEDTQEELMLSIGSPTPGFEDIEESAIDQLHKSVELIDGTYRLVLD